MALNTRIAMKVDATETMTADLATPTARHILEYARTWASGVGAGQADVIWSDTRSLNGTSEDLDLAGVLIGLLGGAALTFAKVKLLMIVNNATTDGYDLAVGGAAANAWSGFVADASDKVVVPAGGLFVWADPNGMTVAAGTGDQLKIDAGSNNVSYSIVVIGTSA